MTDKLKKTSLLYFLGVALLVLAVPTARLLRDAFGNRSPIVNFLHDHGLAITVIVSGTLFVSASLLHWKSKNT